MAGFILYWSNLEAYEACPQRFLWGRGWADIEQGAGAGRRRPVPDPQPSKHHAVMGQIIQAVLEDLYNQRLWQNPLGLEDRLLDLARSKLALALADKRNYVDWRQMSRDEMLRIIEAGISGYLRTMKANRLLGPYAVAEINLVVSLTDPVDGTEWPIGGKPDVVYRRDDTGITILDGKNSQSKGKYTDPDQLRWYALTWFLQHGTMPDRLAFVYYRYPYGKPVEGKPDEIEQGIDWVPFTREDLDGLAARGVAARRGMELRQFDARPAPSTCRFCDYESICPERQAQKEQNRRKKPDPIIASGPVGDDGFLRFDMGGPKVDTPG